LLDIVAHKAAKTTEEATDTEAATIAGISAKISAAQQIQSAAAITYANVLASISAIPVVGPELAPGAAAAAKAEVTGIADSINMAEKGALVPSDQLMFVHQKEMILPANLSTGVQNLITNGGNNNNKTTGETHLHISYSPQVTAVDSAGIGKLLDNHRDTFTKKLSGWSRSGHLQFDGA
jgi:hypothetical protein